MLDYRKYARVNRGYNYILCIIDCFSRYAWAAPLKTKTISETAEAFNKILSSMVIVPRIFKFVLSVKPVSLFDLVLTLVLNFLSNQAESYTTSWWKNSRKVCHMYGF